MLTLAYIILHIYFPLSHDHFYKAAIEEAVPGEHIQLGDEEKRVSRRYGEEGRGAFKEYGDGSNSRMFEKR